MRDERICFIGSRKRDLYHSSDRRAFAHFGACCRTACQYFSSDNANPGADISFYPENRGCAYRARFLWAMDVDADYRIHDGFISKLK